MRIRYARKPLKAKKHYRIRSENANSLCPQTARKPKTLQNPKWECEFGMPDKQSNAKNTIESEVKTRIRYNSTCSKAEITIESEVKMRIRYFRKPLQNNKSLQIRSGNANFECQPSAGQAQFTIDPQRECKF